MTSEATNSELPSTLALRPRPNIQLGERVGVYGGSFDPIHRGHLETVLAAKKEARLDRVLYLPTAYPPHKQDLRQAPIEDRYRMVQLAIADRAGLEVSDDEAGPERTYTIDTLSSLSAEFPGATFVLLIGADSYFDLPKWRSWERIVGGWDIVVLPRPGWPLDDKSQPVRVREFVSQHPERTVLVLDEPLWPVSSSEIRDQIAAGVEIPEDWVPEPVLSFIEERGLYRESADRKSSFQAISEDRETPSPQPNNQPETVTISATDPTAAEAETDEEQNAPSKPATLPADGLTAEAPQGESGAAESNADAKPKIAPLPHEVALAAATALDRQAIDLRLLQVTEVCDFADYFLVCSGNTDRQVAAISDAIQRKLRAIGERPLHVEGERRANWVLLDYGHFLVHVFDPKTRDFYRLERLWSDAPRVPHQKFASINVEASADSDAPVQEEPHDDSEE